MKLSNTLGIISIILVIMSITFKIDYVDLMLSSLVFSLFDSIGWKYIVKDKFKESKSSKIIYRTIQTIFQICIVLFLYYTHGIHIPIMFIVLHFFGIHDLLYYYWLYNGDFYVKDAINGKKIHMSWLWWTVFGIFGKKYQTNINLLWFSVISYVLCLIYLVVI